MIEPPRQWHDPERHFKAAIDSEWYVLVSHLFSLLVNATADFYRARQISPVLLPVTADAVSSPMGLGSDSSPVSVELFGHKTHLADSMQFQLEVLLRHGFKGVYYVMPTFRGEEHDETHLNQFYHSEAEILGGLEEVMTLVEEYVLHLARTVLADPLRGGVHAAAGTLSHLEALAERKSFNRVLYIDAIPLLQPDIHTRTTAMGDAVVTRPGEHELMRMLGDPLWLMNPPSRTVPFYQQARSDGSAATADLLLPRGGEVVGCGARHTTGTEVRAALAAHRVDPEPYHWYVRLKESRPLRTAGFGMGMERFLLWLLRHDDIRDLHVMPRLKGVVSWL